MPGQCLWVDDVEIGTVKGDNLHFTLVSGEERLRFCIPAVLARRAAHGTNAALNERPVGELVEFRRGIQTG